MTNKIQVVLVDMDHTLLNHELTRKIVAEELDARFWVNNESPKPSNVYLSFSKDWGKLKYIGLPNFRRNWLHPETITGVLAISTRDTGPDIFPGWVRLLSGDFKNDETGLVNFCVQFYKKVKTLWSDAALRKRVEEFIVNVNSMDHLYNAFEDAKSFLTLIKNSGSMVYIVTEGDRQVQQEKYERLGFKSLVPQQMFVTTDDLCHPPQLAELRALLKLIGEELQINKSVSKQPFKLKTSITHTNIRLYEEIRYVLDKIPHLEQLTMLERCYRAVSQLIIILSGVRHKAHPLFFRFLIRSIWHSPLQPLDGFKVIFGGVPVPTREIRLAIVGDRYDVDLYPVIASFGSEVITVRIRRGKYHNEYTDDYLDNRRLPAPKMTFNNLGQAAQYLIDRASWNKVPSLMPPALLSESMANLRNDLEICLLFPEKSVLHTVTRTILEP